MTAPEPRFRLRPWEELGWYYALPPWLRGRTRKVRLRRLDVPAASRDAVRVSLAGWVSIAGTRSEEFCPFPCVSVWGVKTNPDDTPRPGFELLAAPWVQHVVNVTQWLPTSARRVAWAIQRGTTAAERVPMTALVDTGGDAPLRDFLLSRPSLCAEMYDPQGRYSEEAFRAFLRASVGAAQGV